MIDQATTADGRLDLSRAIAKFEAAPTPRTCHGCGEEFMGRGLIAFCTACGIRKSDEPNPVYHLGDSWPRLHAGKVANLTGRAATLAVTLSERMDSGRLCVLSGDRGRGKTQIATYIAWKRGQNGKRCGLYTRAFDMCESIIGFDREEKMARFQRAAFLVVDECHRLEPKHLVTLESIIDDRYANQRSTIIIGNWVTEAGIQNGEIVDGVRLFGLGPSLADRIAEHKANKTGGIVWCRWDSYRAKPQHIKLA